MKKIAALVLAVCLMLTMTAAMADTTVVKNYTPEDLVSNTFHNGFVSALNMSGVNTVTLKDDGTYEYTKKLVTTAEDGTVNDNIVYTFIGTYTQDGDTVVLAFPTDGSFKEDWGGLSDMGYFKNSEGGFNDTVQCKEDESHVVSDLFENPYMLDTLASSEPDFDPADYTVTITISGDTFEYVVANSDDD